MKTQSHEYLSALMDAEISQTDELNQALNALLDDDEACQKWHEYHLIRDCLQQRTPVVPLLPESRLHQPKFAFNYVALGGMAAAVAILAVSLVFWRTLEQPSTPLTAQQDMRIHLLENSLNIVNTTPQAKENISFNQAWEKEGQFYLNAHQQVLNEDNMRQASRLMASYQK